MKKLMCVGVCALAIGCGSDEPLGSDDAKVAWDSTQKALAGGGGGTPGALEASTSVDYDCPGGGSMKWDLNVNTSLGVDINDFDPATGSSTDLDYTVTFKKCKADGVKINGQIEYVISAQSSAGSAATSWSYKGDLQYGGDVSGSCIIDMTGSASASAAGASVTYSGTICGNDAGETLNVSTGTGLAAAGDAS